MMIGAAAVIDITQNLQLISINFTIFYTKNQTICGKQLHLN